MYAVLVKSCGAAGGQNRPSGRRRERGVNSEPPEAAENCAGGIHFRRAFGVKGGGALWVTEPKTKGHPRGCPFVLEHRNSIDDSKTWSPTRWGGAFAPYKCFRRRRKPWRRRNSLPPSILKLRMEAASGRRNPKRRTALRLSFFLVTRRGFEPRTHCLKGSCSAD